MKERTHQYVSRLEDNLESLRTHQKPNGRILVRYGNRIRLFTPMELEWIEAVGDNVKLHSLGEVFEVERTLTDLELELDPFQFVRIDKSTIVNVDRIKEIVPHRQRDYSIVLHSGHRLTLRREFVNQFFNIVTTMQR